jgi:hypothetical protein
MRAIGLMVLSCSVVLGSQAFATEDPSEVVNGVYVGHRVGGEDKVVVEVRGSSLVVADKDAVSIGRTEGWALAGPGTKTGGLRFKGEVVALSQTTRAGKARPVRAGAKAFFRFHLESDTGEAALCMTVPGSKVAPPTKVPSRGSSESEPGATCFELTRVWKAAAVVPADGCVVACVARNQMKAVGVEQIEAECRAECAR